MVKQINLYELLWDFDALSLYPSAMWDEKLNCPRIETGYAYTTDIKDELIEKFNDGKQNQGSALLKIEYYLSQNLITQHLPNKERKKIETNRMRNDYIIDTILSVDNEEIVKIGGKLFLK